MNKGKEKIPDRNNINLSLLNNEEQMDIADDSDDEEKNLYDELIKKGGQHTMLENMKRR